MLFALVCVGCGNTESNDVREDASVCLSPMSIVKITHQLDPIILRSGREPQEMSHSFVIRNELSEPCHLRLARVACACMKIGLGDESAHPIAVGDVVPMAPGTSATFHVSIRLESTSGMQDSLFVFHRECSGHLRQICEVRLVFDRICESSSSPPVLDAEFPVGQRKPSLKRFFVNQTTRESDLTLDQTLVLKTVGELVTFGRVAFMKEKRLASGIRQLCWEVEVSIRPPSPGYQSETSAITATWPSRSESPLHIPVTSSIVEGVVVSPKDLRLPAGFQGPGQSRRVLVWSRDRRPFRILEVVTDNENLRARALSSGDSDRHWIEVVALESPSQVETCSVILLCLSRIWKNAPFGLA